MRNLTKNTFASEANPHAWRRALLALYATFFFVGFIIWGVPLDRELVLIWLGGALIIAAPRRASTAKNAIRDWLPFALLLLLYELSRGAADTLGFPVQWQYPVIIDEFLFGGHLPTVTLQGMMRPWGEPRWWEALMSVLYASHFFVPLLVAGWLWHHDRYRWIAYVRRFVVLTLLALVSYIILPTAPPWLAAREDVIEPVVRSASRGWSLLGLDIAGEVLETGQASVNLVAAFPSLHAAYPILLLAFFWPSAGRYQRGLLLIYVVAMGFTLVATGEHYVTDILGSGIYVSAALATVNLWERHMRRPCRQPV